MEAPEKPTETPSMRASRKAVATSAPPRRSLQLKGDPPEYGLYEKPARNANLVHLPRLETEDKESAGSVASSHGSSASKRGADEDPDVSPQSQVQTKMPAVESPPQESQSAIVIDDSDSDEEKPDPSETTPRYESEPEEETKNQADETSPHESMPQPRIEYADEDDVYEIPVKPTEVLARFSEIRAEVVPRISQQVLESAAEIHRQGYDNFLLQQQLQQTAEYRRYAEQLESERNALRVENQQNHELIFQMLEQCRRNEENRIATFVAAMSHLQGSFEKRLQAWTTSIRDAYELQLSEREKSLLWTNSFFTESPEFQSAVQAAVMAERQDLQDQLTVVREESEAVGRVLTETCANLEMAGDRLRVAEVKLTHSKSESDFWNERFMTSNRR